MLRYLLTAREVPQRSRKPVHWNSLVWSLKWEQIASFLGRDVSV